MEIDQDIRKILEQYKLNLSGLSSITELPSGINSVYKIVVGDSTFVLKEYLKRKSPLIDSIHKAITELIQQDISIPNILKNKQDNYLTKLGNRNFDLSEYIHTIDPNSIKQNDLISRSAKELANIHSLGIDLKIDGTDRTDYQGKIKDVKANANRFIEEFKTITENANDEEIIKLKILKEFLEKTENIRNTKSNFKFFNELFIMTHGDFSPVNILISESNKLFVIDWDSYGLKPLIWSIQSSASLFATDGKYNAYLVQPDYERLKIFFNAYFKENPIQNEHLCLLPEVVEYNFLFHWLGYTLPPIIQKDFRLLSLIPPNIEKTLYWMENIEKYKDFIKEF